MTKIDKKKLLIKMMENGIKSYEMLSVKMNTYTDASYPSIMRWNREGWPDSQVNVVCLVLGCKKVDLI